MCSQNKDFHNAESIWQHKHFWALPETEKWMQTPSGGVLFSLCHSLTCISGLEKSIYFLLPCSVWLRGWEFSPIFPRHVELASAMGSLLYPPDCVPPLPPTLITFFTFLAPWGQRPSRPALPVIMPQTENVLFVNVWIELWNFVYWASTKLGIPRILK